MMVRAHSQLLIGSLDGLGFDRRVIVAVVVVRDVVLLILYMFWLHLHLPLLFECELMLVFVLPCCWC